MAECTVAAAGNTAKAVMAVDRGATLFAIVALAAVVSATLLIAPVVIGALISHERFSVQQAALTLSLELAAMSLASVPALWWLPRLNWHSVSRRALAVMIVGNGLCALTPGFAMLATLRFVTGLAGGSIMVICLAVVGMTRASERNFGLWAVGQLILGAVGLAVLPRVIPLFGLGALYVALAVLLAMLVPLAGRLPERAAAPPDAKASAPLLRPGSVMALAAVLVFYVALSGVWAYLERLGAQEGLAAARIGDDLMIASLFGIAGCLSAVGLGARWGRLRPLTLGYLLLIGSIAGFYAAGTQALYLTAAAAFKYAWTFVLPFILACLAARDRSGRLVSLANLMIGTGLAFGPTVVALTLGNTPDYHRALPVGLAGAVLSMGLILIFERAAGPGGAGS